MKFIMMRKGCPDVLAVFDDSQKLIKAGCISAEVAENILQIGAAKAHEEVFFVPTETGKMPLSIKKDKIFSLPEFMEIKPEPKEQKARVVSVEQKIKVEKLLVNEVSVNKTAELTNVSRSTVKRIKKTLSLPKTSFKPTSSKGSGRSEPTNLYHSTHWWVHGSIGGNKRGNLSA